MNILKSLWQTGWIALYRCCCKIAEEHWRHELNPSADAAGSMVFLKTVIFSSETANAKKRVKTRPTIIGRDMVPTASHNQLWRGQLVCILCHSPPICSATFYLHFLGSRNFTFIAPVACSRSEEDFVTEEQLEVERNRAVQQASSRGKADRFVLSSATKSSSDRNRSQWVSSLLPNQYMQTWVCMNRGENLCFSAHYRRGERNILPWFTQT